MMQVFFWSEGYRMAYYESKALAVLTVFSSSEIGYHQVLVSSGIGRIKGQLCEMPLKW